MPYTASNFPGSFNELILTPTHTHRFRAPKAAGDPPAP